MLPERGRFWDHDRHRAPSDVTRSKPIIRNALRAAAQLYGGVFLSSVDDQGQLRRAFDIEALHLAAFNAEDVTNHLVE